MTMPSQAAYMPVRMMPRTASLRPNFLRTWLTKTIRRLSTDLRIDRTHRKWALLTAISFVVALVIYVAESLASAHGASGGSPIGIAFGGFGYALMLFAALLSLR